MTWPNPFAAAGEAVTGHAELGQVIDAEGWLHGPRARRWPSVRHSPLTTPDEEPIGVVWHYTAVRPGTALWKRIRTYRSGVDRAASWHALVEADGTIHQSISFRRGAWHCSAGQVMSRTEMVAYRPNRCTVGIELASENGKGFPAAQRWAAIALLDLLCAAYPVSHPCLLHSELDPKRRADPGPEWEAVLDGWVTAAMG